MFQYEFLCFTVASSTSYMCVNDLGVYVVALSAGQLCVCMCVHQGVLGIPGVHVAIPVIYIVTF